MNKTLRLFALFSILLFGGGALRLAADPVSEAQQRITARLAEVNSLLKSGAIGENNRGFLEVRGGGGNASAVVSAENHDRGVLYAEGARRTNTSAEEVGRSRARQIAANTAPGVWIQGEDGNWRKK